MGCCQRFRLSQQGKEKARQTGNYFCQSDFENCVMLTIQEAKDIRKCLAKIIEEKSILYPCDRFVEDIIHDNLRFKIEQAEGKR